MKVGHVTERTDAAAASSFLDNDELDRSGVDLGTTGRLQLMARLAEGEATSPLTPGVTPPPPSRLNCVCGQVPACRSLLPLSRRCR